VNTFYALLSFSMPVPFLYFFLQHISSIRAYTVSMLRFLDHKIRRTRSVELHWTSD